MSHRGRGHPKGTRSVERELEITRAATVHCTTTFKRPNSMVENILPDSNLPPFPSLDLCHSIDTWSSSHGMDVEAPPVTKGFQVSDLKIRRQEDCAYEKEIAAYLFNTETMSRTPNWSKLGITPHMRAVLIDWLIEVADEYHLQDQTLILAIMYLDGSLVAPVPVTKETLQLLGVTCMFLAAYATVVRALRFPRKHEEVFPPPLLEFAYITDGAYNADDIRYEEFVVLKALDYKLTLPTIVEFLPNALISCKIDSPDQKNFAMYLFYTIAPSQLFARYLPSELASAIAIITKYTFDIFWQHVQSQLSLAPQRTTSKRILACIADVFEYCSAPPRVFTAAKEKFSKKEFHNASAVSLPPTLPL